MDEFFAHSAPKGQAWEPLETHLAAVAATAARFADGFGWAAVARQAGDLHDLGKMSAKFQAYLRGECAKGGDHSSAGARLAAGSYPPPMGMILAAIIASHHSGLDNGIDLKQRLENKSVPTAWKQAASLTPAQQLMPQGWTPGSRPGFSMCFLIRMLFSCLVDADFLETESFYTGPRAKVGEPLAVLRARLHDHMAVKAAGATDTDVNRLRAAVLAGALDKAAMPPGLFTLTVPTGGGKTLASLSFALQHAAAHGLNRVIYVIPYTSIVEQTAKVFRNVLGDGNVLEHHASFDWEDAARKARPEDENEDENATDVSLLQKATENWDAPIVVTTAVQFFQSLFACRTSRCRKLHNIAHSVVILDEAQTLPQPLLQPCLAAVEELARNYRTSIVLCTATQPAIRVTDGFEGGLAIDDEHELAPDPKRLYTALKRTHVENRGATSDDDIKARFGETEQMLCIVNNRSHAQGLFRAIRDLPGAVHLTTLMCPRHRRKVLGDVRRRLKDGEPVRVVSTSLIEAGVDVDFPEVWRAAAGLESIAQAAGRCNREGRRDMGRVVVFEPTEAKPPHELKQRWQAAAPLFGRYEDVQSLDAVKDYFQTLYWVKGEGTFDSAPVGEKKGILTAIAERKTDLTFPFKDIAEAFRMIDDWTVPVIVPWRENADDTQAADLLAAVAAMEKPARGPLRRLQQYTVSVPPAVFQGWLAAGAVKTVHKALGETMMTLADDALYDPEMGIVLDAALLRRAETNIWP